MRLTETHERVLIVLIALHSIIIGAMLFLFPTWTIRFAGWTHIDPPFFGYQAGAFHFALASAYLIEYFKYRGISVLLAAKSIALVFLVLTAVIDGMPWAVPVSGLGDGAMAALALFVHRKVRS